MYYFISQIIINFLLKKIVLNFWSLLEFLLKKKLFYFVFFANFASILLRDEHFHCLRLQCELMAVEIIRNIKY